MEWSTSSGVLPGRGQQGLGVGGRVKGVIEEGQRELTSGKNRCISIPQRATGQANA